MLYIYNLLLIIQPVLYIIKQAFLSLKNLNNLSHQAMIRSLLKQLNGRFLALYIQGLIWKRVLYHSLKKDYSRLGSRIILLLKTLRDPIQLYSLIITLLLVQAR